MQKQKGFTIIELIVVIAIIAVLASIVLVNVTQYISKGKDSAAQGNLTSMLTNSAIYYDDNSNYTNYISGLSAAGGQVVFTVAGTGTGGCSAATAGDPGFISTCEGLVASNMDYDVTSSVNTAGTVGTDWCACVPLKATAFIYCVDSTGNKKTVANTTTCATECPAATARCL